MQEILRQRDVCSGVLMLMAGPGRGADAESNESIFVILISISVCRVDLRRPFIFHPSRSQSEAEAMMTEQRRLSAFGAFVKL